MTTYKIMGACSIALLALLGVGYFLLWGSSALADISGLRNSLPSARSITVGETKLSLLAVYPSTSQTIVKLLIEDPILEQSNDKWVFLPLRTLNLTLEGFNGDKIYGQDINFEGEGQLTTLNLDSIKNLDEAVAIEVSNLRRRSASGGQYETLPGPWRFEFTPNASEEQRFSRRTEVNEKKKVDGVEIILTEINESSSETRVSYKQVAPSGINVQTLGAPSISDGIQTFEGREHASRPGDAHWVRDLPSHSP